MSLSKFSLRLRELMEERNVNKATLCKECKLYNNQIKYWEDTESVPKFDVIDRIAMYFNVSTQYLAGYSDERGKYLSKEELKESPNVQSLEKAIFADSPVIHKKTEDERANIIANIIVNTGKLDFSDLLIVDYIIELIIKNKNK